MMIDETSVPQKTVTVENFAKMSLEKRKLVWAWREHFDFETINTSILKNNPGAFAICTRLFGLKVVGESEREYFVRYTKDDWMKVSPTFKQKILSNAQVGETRWI